MHLIVTVDTEADDQWKEDVPLTLDNVSALPRFQSLCEKYDIIPTYFVTYEVATHQRISSFLKKWQDEGKAEIGAHLHPWTTPPLKKGEGNTRAFPSELPDDVLREKLTNLTDTIERTFGKRPTSYRAGRWGYDARQAAILKVLGYIVDSSITPGLSWESRRGTTNHGPDFVQETVEPHMLNDTVLEVPMTIIRAGLLRRVRWLRIFENTTYRDLANVVDTAIRRQLPVVVFMIHSSELVAGKSPYVKDETALTHVYTRMEELFALCKEKKISCRTLSSFAEQYITIRHA